MRKLLCVILFLLFPVASQAWTITQNFNTSISTSPGQHDIGSGWACEQLYSYNGLSIDSGTGTTDPPNAIRFFWPDGTENGGYPGKCWVGLPSPTRQFWMEYYFKYSNNWQWHGVNNKHWYHHADAPARDYRLIGGVNGERKFQTAFSVQSPSPGTGYFSNTGYEPIIEAGRWYKFEMQVNYGDPGVANGSWKIWIDDKLVQDYSGKLMLFSTDTGINFFEIGPVWGGYTPGLYAAQDMSVWFDKITISTNGLTISVDRKMPYPPKSLSIK